MSFKEDVEKELRAIIELALPSIRQRINLPQADGKDQEALIHDLITALRLIVLYQMFDLEASEREFMKRLKYKNGDA